MDRGYLGIPTLRTYRAVVTVWRGGLPKISYILLAPRGTTPLPAMEALRPRRHGRSARRSPRGLHVPRSRAASDLVLWRHPALCR